MPLLRFAPLAFVAVLAGAGCSPPAVDDVSDASSSMTDAVVLVERAVSGDHAIQTNVSAKFMRLSAPADPGLAERLIGARLDLPNVGECAFAPATDVADGTPSLASLGPIVLIDVGDLNVRIEAPPTQGSSLAWTAMPLASRAFPDVGELVSGVFYTSRDAASDLPANAIYVLESTGSPAVDRFSIATEAPTAPEDVRVGDAPLEGGVQLDEGAPAVVRWRAPGGAKGDVILVDVRGASGAAVRCAFKDAGEGAIPGQTLRANELSALGATPTVSVHRIRRYPFGTQGLDAGEIRFDLSVIGRATVAGRAR